MKTIYVIIDPLITDENSWESHVASMLQGYVEAFGLENFQIKQFTDLQEIKNLFIQGVIKPVDKFIFPNAWSSMTNYVRHWSENYQTPVEMIGFWSRGCYLNQDSEYRPLNDRNWRKVYERSNFRCLNKSFFISEFHKEQFRIYVSKFVFPERLNVMPFPLEYLSLDLSVYTDVFYKQELIVFPWNKYSILQEQIMYDFIRVFKGVQVIFAQENAPLTREQLLRQISRAKIVFLPYESPNIGKEIYECLLLGAIPLVPDIEGLKDLVPEEFRYPVEWTSTIFNYSKFGPNLTNKIKNLIDNFSSYESLIKKQERHNFENYYDSEKFIKEIFGNDIKN
jgi:hypothetical protein